MTREELNSLLSEGITSIVFLKKDGTERVMLATKNTNIIPEDQHVKDDPDKPKRKVSDAVVQVYDVEKDGWRSFIFDNLIMVNGQPV